MVKTFANFKRNDSIVLAPEKKCWDPDCSVSGTDIFYVLRNDLFGGLNQRMVRTGERQRSAIRINRVVRDFVIVMVRKPQNLQRLEPVGNKAY